MLRSLAQPQLEPTTPPAVPSTSDGGGNTLTLFTPRKQRAVEEAITHLRETDAAFVTHPAEHVTSNDQLPPAIFVQVPPTPEKARRLLQAPLDPSSRQEDLVQENIELRAQLDAMRSRLDGARRIVEGSNATVAITQVGYSQMSRKLHWKEQNKSVKNKLLSTKVGRYITSDRFREVVAADHTARKVMAKEKVARNQQRQLRKEAAAWRKSATERKKNRRKRDLALYEKARAAAQHKGVRLPQKPKAPPREPTPERFRIASSHRKQQQEGDSLTIEVEDVGGVGESSEDSDEAIDLDDDSAGSELQSILSYDDESAEELYDSFCEASDVD